MPFLRIVSIINKFKARHIRCICHLKVENSCNLSLQRVMTVVFLIKLELEFDFIKSNAHEFQLIKTGSFYFWLHQTFRFHSSPENRSHKLKQLMSYCTGDY